MVHQTLRVLDLICGIKEAGNDSPMMILGGTGNMVTERGGNIHQAEPALPKSIYIMFITSVTPSAEPRRQAGRECNGEKGVGK